MRHEKPSLSVVPPGSADPLPIGGCRTWQEHRAHSENGPCPTHPPVQGWVFGTCGLYVEPTTYYYDLPEGCDVCCQDPDAHTLDRVMFRLCRYRDRLTDMAESCINPDSQEWLTVTAGVLDQIITKTREDQ